MAPSEALPHGALALEPPPGAPLARPLRDVFHLPAQEERVAEARRRVHERLREWNVAESSCQDVRLLVSELFTNAVKHTDSGSISCELWVIGVRLRLEVCDDGGRGSPAPSGAAPGDADGEGGRGLLIVNVLAEDWGIRPEDEQPGHAVWVELPCARTVD